MALKPVDRVGGDLDRLLLVGPEDRHQRGCELGQVPKADRGLVRVGVAAAMVDRTEDLARMEAVHEGAGAEIDGFAGKRDIVGVHHAVDEPDPHPGGNQACLHLHDPFEQTEDWVRRFLDLRMKSRNRVVGQDAQRLRVVS